MSIADHFDHTPDAGFVRRYDTSSARRQFQLSLVLMVLLATTAFVLGALIRFDDGAAAAGAVTTPASVTKPMPRHKRASDSDFAGTLVRVQG